jgi:hypothetical protein
MSPPGQAGNNQFLTSPFFFFIFTYLMVTMPTTAAERSTS